jgi:peptidoglycan endopeptidase LytF
MATDESQPGVRSADTVAAAPSPTNTAKAEMMPPATPSTATAAGMLVVPAKSYMVKKGDSLWKIAKAEGVSQIELAKANNLNKNSLLKVGQKLQIPQVAKVASATPAAAAAAAIPSSPDALGATATAASADAGSIYLVKSGDSLWKIAQNHHVNVSAIKQANNLSGDSLKIGQKLKMPAATSSMAAASAASDAGVFHPGTATEKGQTVHYVDIGESPAVIARKYGVKVDELMRINNVTDPKKIQVGQRLVIPVVATAAAPATPTASTTTSAAMPTAGAAHAANGAPALAAPVVTTGPAVIQ